MDFLAAAWLVFHILRPVPNDPTSAERMVQVWSRHSSRAQKPPKTGWNIPWDGPVRTTLVGRYRGKRQRERNKKSPKNYRVVDLARKIKAIPWKPIFRSIASSYHLWLCFRKCIQIYNLELTSLEILKC